jgi:hypothetical protein
MLLAGAAHAQSPMTCAEITAVSAAASLDGYARALAGLPGGGDDAVLAAHASQMQRSFERLQSGQFRRIRDWSARALPTKVHDADVVWYPFSGPDVLYPAALFPKASHLVFTGLEPVGAPPQAADFESPALADSLGELRRSLATLLGQSFFVTAQMQQQFARNRFRGVTPILMLLLARSGYHIDSVAGVVLTPEGQLCGRDVSERIDHAGVQIRYHLEGEDQSRTLTYLRVDLSNKGLEQMPGYALWIKQIGVHASYIKSASYLMHIDAFSGIRELLLTLSPALLQDDSGIPYRWFPEDQWQSSFYGHYGSAAEGFGGHTQPALRKAFAGAPALDFWIGYRHSAADSNLQLYQRRAAAP